MLTKVDVKFISIVHPYRAVQVGKYTPNKSQCRPSSCLLAVLAMFLDHSSP